jgi:hypothetical protein
MLAEATGWVLAIGFAVLFAAAVGLLAYYLWRIISGARADPTPCRRPGAVTTKPRISAMMAGE